MTLTPDLASALNLSTTLNAGDGTTPARIPMQFTCSSWKDQGIPPVALLVNPHSVSFKQPKRITKKNTQGGTAYFHWTDQNGQNNDILEMSFKGRTGSILNRPAANATNSGVFGAVANGLSTAAAFLSGENTPPSNTTNGSAKQFLWARLYGLTRHPMIDPQTQKRVSFDTLYRSPLFPAPILFTGFFNNVLEFSETAESPFLVEWSFSFIVQTTNPSLDQLTQYLATYIASPSTLASSLAGEAAFTDAIENASISAASNPTKYG